MKALTTVPTVGEAPLLTARDTFGPLHMSETTGYMLISKGEFPVAVRKVGGRWMVRTADLRVYLGLDEAARTTKSRSNAGTA